METFDFFCPLLAGQQTGPQQYAGQAGPPETEAAAAGEGLDPHLGKNGAPGQAAAQAQERGAQGGWERVRFGSTGVSFGFDGWGKRCVIGRPQGAHGLRCWWGWGCVLLCR